MSAFLDKDGN
jgi:hypothetical protein